jgi:hypothetical protein
MTPTLNHEPNIVQSPTDVRADEGQGKTSGAPHSTEHDKLASSLPFRRKLAVKEGPVQKPEPDKDFIKTAALSGQPDGKAKVAAYSEAKMLKGHGQELQQLSEASAQSQDNLRGIERNIKELTQILGETDRYQEIRTANEPWNWIDRVQIIVYGIASITLLAVGLNSMARVLMSSGLPAFEHLLPCYLFSMIPILFPFAFKAIGRLFNTSSARKRYHVAVWIVGVLFGVAWVFLFARTFSGVTQSATDIINNLSLDQTASGARGANWLLIAVGIFAEGFFAAGCWLTIEAICEKHLLSKRVVNRAYETVQEDLSRWRRLEEEEKEYQGKVDGRIQAIKGAITELVLEAVNFYHAVQAADAHHRELSELLKSNTKNT